MNDRISKEAKVSIRAIKKLCKRTGGKCKFEVIEVEYKDRESDWKVKIIWGHGYFFGSPERARTFLSGVLVGIELS